MDCIWTTLRSMNKNWGSSFQSKNDRLIAYVIVFILCFSAILDRALDWKNYSDVSDPDYNYGLAAGAIDKAAHDGLFVFALFGTVFSVFEIVNTLTLMCCVGHVVIPVELEQGVILLVEQIPQAIINLAITICRNNIVTPHQAWACFWGVVNTALRLYAYGYLKEKLYKTERSGVVKTTKIAIYITSTFLWLFLLFDNGFLWHHARLGHEQFHQQSDAINQIEGVSITLVRTATHTELPANISGSISYHYEKLREELGTEKPWLVENIADIAKNKNKSLIADYKCRKSSFFFEPEPCDERDVTHIRFRFDHVVDKNKLHVQPIGEIQYNFAMIHTAGNENGTKDCNSRENHVLGDWELEYFRFVLVHNPYTREKQLQAKTAWIKVCHIPVLKYNEKIKVC